MKNISVYFTLLLLLISCSSVEKQGHKKLLIAVPDIANMTGNPEYDSITGNLCGIYINELYKTGCCRIIERKRLTGILEKHSLNMSGLTEPENAVRVGRLLGVDALLFINLDTVKYTDRKTEVSSPVQIYNAGNFIHGLEELEITVSGRLVKVDTGEILASSSDKTVLNNKYTSLNNIFKQGEKIDVKNSVIKALSDSAGPVSQEIARQITGRPNQSGSGEQ